jgi:fermentation-respiration switch protein FrsA (DUF1100 family)
MNPADQPADRRNPAAVKKRRVMAILSAGLLVACTWGFVARHNIHSEWNSWRPNPSLSALPTAGPLTRARTVVIDTDKARIVAWYLPPVNGAVIILAHGFAGNREQMTHEAETLANAGFGVFVPDLTGNGESSGDPDTTHDVVVISKAVDWVAAQTPGVRVGALGFSGGAMAATLATVDDSRILALVSVSGKSDDWEFTKLEHGKHGWVTIIPGALVATVRGEAWSELRPVKVVSKIAPRPVFFIHGTQDPVVPVWMARSLYDSAKEPKSLWLIEGGGHGRLWSVPSGADYDGRLVKFFTDALLPR